MFSTILIKVVELFADLLLSYLIENNASVKLKERQLRKKIRTGIENAFTETIGIFPNSQYIFENFDLSNYLNNIIVKSELAKILLFSERINIEVLFDEWNKQSGIQNVENLKPILSSFILNMQEQLRKIPEINEIFHINDTREIKATVNAINEKFQNLEKTSLKVSGLDNDEKLDVEIKTKFEFFVRLYREGNVNTSLDQTREFEEKLPPSKRTPEFLAKIYSLIGGCLISLDKINEATGYLEKAYLLNPDSSDIIANYALLKILRNEYKEALELAEISLQKNPNQTLAQIIKIDSLTQKDVFEIHEVIKNIDVNDSTLAVVIGLAYEKISDYEKSEYYLRKALELNPNNINAKVTLSGILIRKRLRNKSIIGNTPDLPFTSDEISEISRLIDEAFIEAQKIDNRFLFLQVQASRGGIRGLLGQSHEARRDCEAVLTIDENHLLALQNCALVECEERNFIKAKEYLDKIPLNYLEENNIINIKIAVLIELELFIEAKALLDNYLPSITDVNYYDFIFLYALIEYRQGHYESLDSIREMLFLEKHIPSLAHETSGKILYLLKNIPQCISEYIKSQEFYSESYDINDYATFFL